MKIKNRIKTRILALTATAWLVFALVECPVVGANDYCADNKAYPPFLVSAGVTPNLLMLIDNSASMNDLAYVGDQGYCYDNTYSSSSGYAGNFEPTTWYYWYGPYNNFYTIANSTAASLCSAADYYNTDVCVDFTSTSDFNFFTAKGNFLNWVAASKLDIQKEILTGGKYDGSSLRLLGESRGCLNRRFVKEVTVRDSGGTTYDLTLAVRPPDASEKESGTDAATRIELYGVDGTGGFDNTNCQLALEELQKDSPNQGQLKQYIEDCMLYSQGQSRGFSNYMAAFNHSIHNCWYYQKHGFWPPGNGPVQSIMPACESVYTDDQYGSDPPDITTDDRGYVCYGDYDTGAGYVGRCWDPSLVTYKTNGNLDTPGWTSDECIEQALMDYCGILTVPDVVDPSDQSAITGEFWNIPAVLIDSGVVAQLNEPKEVMATNIYIGANAPSGLIQEFTQDLRMGAMVFNDDGSKSECSMTDPHILYACNDAGNKDGGRVISYIDSGTTHTTDLVNAINGIQATSWTPLAETMYNAIGYYTQNSTMRLDAADFLVGAQYDPVLAYCQDNNILIITEGASTADQASAVSTFALSSGQNDGSDSDPPSGCSDMNGSTFLDDLTWYANNGTDIYPSEPYDEDKHNITTHNRGGRNPAVHGVR